MRKLIISIAIVMAASPALAQTAPVASKSGYGNDLNLLGDPSVLNRSIEACSHSAIKPDVQRSLAKLFGVAEANVRYEFCRRIYTAYAKGAIPYADYAQFAGGGGMPASILRALRIPGSAPLKERHERTEIVLPASATMDSGERFKGSTIASGTSGHFVVRSSRRSIKCAGDYDLRDRRPTVTLSVKCSDGRTGEVFVTRSADLMSAWGKVKLSDGSTGRVIVGTARRQL